MIHITTGTHVAQICLYLLTGAHHLNGKLIQTAPPDPGHPGPGRYQIIDLDLARYHRIASRFVREHLAGTAYLKNGIATRIYELKKQRDQVSGPLVQINCATLRGDSVNDSHRLRQYLAKFDLTFESLRGNRVIKTPKNRE